MNYYDLAAVVMELLTNPAWIYVLRMWAWHLVLST